MILTLLVTVGVVLALGLALFLVCAAWGYLSFRELPLFSEGDEPTTVRRLPEIDLPLDREE